jgi:NaMN:DMB phosphoribosyltransferase
MATAAVAAAAAAAMHQFDRLCIYTHSTIIPAQTSTPSALHVLETDSETLVPATAAPYLCAKGSRMYLRILSLYMPSP